jgi:transposase
MAYPIELRQRVIEKDDEGLTQSEIADDLSVSLGWVNKVLQCYRKFGVLMLPGKKPGPKPKLDEKARELLLGWVDHDPDLTLHGLAEKMSGHIGKKVNAVNIFSALKAKGYSHKKNACS